MTLRSCFAALFLSVGTLMTSPATADDVAPSARVSSAVLVRQGPSTDTAILARLRPGESARLVDEISGWYVIELADGTRGYVSKAWTIVITDGGTEALSQRGYKIHVIDVGTGLAVFVEGPSFGLLPV